MALNFTARVWWTKRTRRRRAVGEDAKLLLEVLTPIARTGSEWCLEANSLAIRIRGGCSWHP